MKTSLGFSLLLALCLATAAHAQDVRPEHYGAVGDGVSNDREAMQAAFNVVGEGGGRIRLMGGRTYYLGTLSGKLASAIHATNLKNVVVDGHGAEIVVETLTQDGTCIFNLTNPTDVTFNNLSLRDKGADWFVKWKGASAFRLLAIDSPNPQPGGITIKRCRGTSLLTFVQCAGETAYRLNGVKVTNCTARECYYGVNCQNNGDGVVVTGTSFFNCRRPYFVYGVSNHNVDLTIHHDGVARGSSAAIVVGDLGFRHTKNIRVKARFHGNTSQYLTGLNIEHQRPAGAVPGSISDVVATIDVYAPSTMVPVLFRSYLVNGATYTVEPLTLNRTDRVTIMGNLATTAKSPVEYVSRGP